MIIFAVCGILLASSALSAKLDIIVGDQDVEVGKTILLLCKADVEGDFTWTKDNDEDIDEDRHIIEKVDESTNKLKLRNIQLVDSGLYTCLFENEHGQKRNNVQMFVYKPLDFGATRTYHEFLVNQTVSIPCLVSGKPEVEIHWIRNQRIVEEGGRGHLKILPDRSLQILRIQKEDRGTYICEGKIKGRPISRSLAISVVVNEPPTVLMRQERKSVFAGPNTSVSILCLVEGHPTPNISWIYPSRPDESRYQHNSDRSELTISAVSRSDFGEYVCTASNKIGENSGVFVLDVSERPSVVVDRRTLAVAAGENAFVLCNATGHPAPSVQWIKKDTQEKMGERSQDQSELVLSSIRPSDGGIYICEASNMAGTTTEEVQLTTWPGTPQLSLLPGSSSSIIIDRVSVEDGGSPVVQYLLQWKKEAEESWSEREAEATGPLLMQNLEPYTEFYVRLAAKNSHFLGNFSEEYKISTLSQNGEPNIPVISLSEKKLVKNSVFIPVKVMNDGDSPISHYNVRYRVMKENEEWLEREIPANSSRIQLEDLQYDSHYQMEVFAVNHNGSSSSAKVNFTIPQPVVQAGLGKGGVVGIVMFIFLVLMLSVDAFCCYTHRCGLINFFAGKLFGHKASGSKGLDEESSHTFRKKPENADATKEKTAE